MYIKRADILYSIELLDLSLMRSVTFNRFIDEIFVLLFDNTIVYPKKEILSETSSSLYRI